MEQVGLPGSSEAGNPPLPPLVVSPGSSSEEETSSNTSSGKKGGHVSTGKEIELHQLAEKFMGSVSTRSFKRKTASTDGVRRTAEDVAAEKFTIFKKVFSADVETGLQGVEDDSEGEGEMKKTVKLSLEWKNINYSVEVGKKKNRKTKVILRDISAFVAPGRLVAVMGPTGCGKTSLINALAGRLPVGGTCTGEVLVNGQPRSKSFRNVTAYVLQDDVLFHNLTVMETLTFAANMRLPGNVSRENRQKVVDGVIAELGLAKAANTCIGNAFVRGISGGERKRCNIAVEMMANPSLIFLDEPTSGLDSFQAQNVMEALWNLANNGRSVVSTIHQPRSSIYSMFDALLLLSEGMTVYFGPANQATAYFESLGYTCPAHYNPADFFLDVISMDYRTPEAEKDSRNRVQLLSDVYLEQEVGLWKKGDHPDTEGLHGGIEKAFSFTTGWPTQLRLLLQRQWMQSSRDRIPLIISLVQNTVIGVVLGALYSNISRDQKGIQDRTGVLFFMCIFVAMGQMFLALNTFPVDKGVVNRERASKSYRVSPYYMTKMLAETPARIVTTLIFSSIVYWMIGLNAGAKNFFLFVVIFFLEGTAASGVGIAISAACPNEKLSLTLAPALTIIFILFGGFYINTASIPRWLFWISYLSHLYYAFAGLAVNEFQGTCCYTCNDTCLTFVNGVCTAYAPTNGCLKTGDQIVDRLGFGNWEVWYAIVGLVGLTCLYNFLGYVALRRSKPRFQALTAAKTK